MAKRKVNIALYEDDARVAEMIQKNLSHMLGGEGASLSNCVRYALRATAHRMGHIAEPPKVEA